MSIAQWKNLPDPWSWGGTGPHPRCIVHIHLDNIKHIVQRHVSNRAEPWSEWAGPATVSGLLQAENGNARPEVWRGPATNLAEAMKPAVSKSFHRPLAITLRECRVRHRIEMGANVPKGRSKVHRGPSQWGDDSRQVQRTCG